MRPYILYMRNGNEPGTPRQRFKMDAQGIKEAKTYQLRARLLELGDYDSNRMPDVEFDAWVNEKKEIRLELTNREKEAIHASLHSRA